MSRFVASIFVVCVAQVSIVLAVGPNAEELSNSRQRAVNFLETSQAADGSWTTPQSPTISGLVTFSLLQSGVPANDPVIEKALKHLESFVQPDGGVYAPKSQLANYETSINSFRIHDEDSMQTSLTYRILARYPHDSHVHGPAFIGIQRSIRQEFATRTLSPS